LATTTTTSIDKLGKTVEEMTKSAQQTGQIVSGYLVEAQEINTELTRKTTETWIEAFRKQTDLNQRMVQRLYGETEGQTEAFQSLMRNWMSTYPVPFFNPFAYWREGFETATRNIERITDVTRKSATVGVARTNGGFPIAGYDEMTVAEISEKLDKLSAEELEKVRDYEKRNKNRDTLIEQIDRKIKATA
jgi:hypothetical protein